MLRNRTWTNFTTCRTTTCLRTPTAPANLGAKILKFSRWDGSTYLKRIKTTSIINIYLIHIILNQKNELTCQKKKKKNDRSSATIYKWSKYRGRNFKVDMVNQFRSRPQEQFNKSGKCEVTYSKVLSSGWKRVQIFKNFELRLTSQRNFNFFLNFRSALLTYLLFWICSHLFNLVQILWAQEYPTRATYSEYIYRYSIWCTLSWAQECLTRTIYFEYIHTYLIWYTSFEHKSMTHSGMKRDSDVPKIRKLKYHKKIY